MGKIYVYSTLSNDQMYTSYQVDPKGQKLPQAIGQIFIAGKANITTKNFVTPKGMVTEVTPEQLAELKGNELFNLHMKNGFIKVSERKGDTDEVAADMVGRDQSAPLVAEDFKEGEAPTSNADKSAPKSKRNRE